jgi:hypothetical protein
MELIEPAKFVGREKDLSTIAAGKFADLVLLDANPLEDIRNTSKIDTVILGGRLYDRSEFNALLARAERGSECSSHARSLIASSMSICCPRIVGNPYLTGLRKGCPLSTQNHDCVRILPEKKFLLMEANSLSYLRTLPSGSH